MPPPLLYPFPLFGLLFRSPLSKRPLPVLALKERLNFWEQDTGQGFHFMVGYPGAVVVDFFFLAMEAAKVLRARCRFIWESGLASPL